jgi:hypothetical protein
MRPSELDVQITNDDDSKTTYESCSSFNSDGNDQIDFLQHQAAGHESQAKKESVI